MDWFGITIPRVAQVFAATAIVGFLSSFAVVLGQATEQLPPVEINVAERIPVADAQATLPPGGLAVSESVSVAPAAVAPHEAVSVLDTVDSTVDPAQPSLTTVVNTTFDNFDGRCDELHCSLRERIFDANLAAIPATIAFDIPTSTDPGYDEETGTFTIRPTTPLPQLAGALVVDGYSQPGASPNP